MTQEGSRGARIARIPPTAQALLVHVESALQSIEKCPVRRLERNDF